MKSKIAFVIGHHKLSKGANSWFNLREYDFYKQTINELEKICNYEFDVYEHDHNITGYTSRIKNTAKKLNKHNYGLVVELHFNSFFEDIANGCETLYFYRSVKGKEFASKFSEIVNESTGIKLRNNGLKALSNKKDRGFASVYYPKAPAILIEPFFGSNLGDCNKIQNPHNMAIILNKFVNSIKHDL